MYITVFDQIFICWILDELDRGNIIQELEQREAELLRYKNFQLFKSKSMENTYLIADEDHPLSEVPADFIAI